MGRQPEADVKRSVIDALRWRGWLVFTIQQNTFGTKGLPDLMAVSRRGLVVFIEVKRPGGRLRPRQKEVALELLQRDCIFLLVDDVRQIDDFAEQCVDCSSVVEACGIMRARLPGDGVERMRILVSLGSRETVVDELWGKEADG